MSNVKEGNLTVDIRNKPQNINDRKLINDKEMIVIYRLLSTGGHLVLTAASLSFMVEHAGL